MLGKDASEGELPGRQEKCRPARVEILRSRNEAKTSEGAFVLRVE